MRRREEIEALVAELAGKRKDGSMHAVNYEELAANIIVIHTAILLDIRELLKDLLTK